MTAPYFDFQGRGTYASSYAGGTLYAPLMYGDVITLNDTALDTFVTQNGTGLSSTAGTSTATIALQFVVDSAEYSATVRGQKAVLYGDAVRLTVMDNGAGLDTDGGKYGGWLQLYTDTTLPVAGVAVPALATSASKTGFDEGTWRFTSTERAAGAAVVYGDKLTVAVNVNTSAASAGDTIWKGTNSYYSLITGTGQLFQLYSASSAGGAAGLPFATPMAYTTVCDPSNGPDEVGVCENGCIAVPASGTSCMECPAVCATTGLSCFSSPQKSIPVQNSSTCSGLGCPLKTGLGCSNGNELMCDTGGDGVWRCDQTSWYMSLLPVAVIVILALSVAAFLYLQVG